jgi:hypothetical protein
MRTGVDRQRRVMSGFSEAEKVTWTYCRLFVDDSLTAKNLLVFPLDDRLTASYSGPEVRFWEVAVGRHWRAGHFESEFQGPTNIEGY